MREFVAQMNCVDFDIVIEFLDFFQAGFGSVFIQIAWLQKELSTKILKLHVFLVMNGKLTNS